MRRHRLDVPSPPGNARRRRRRVEQRLESLPGPMPNPNVGWSPPRLQRQPPMTDLRRWALEKYARGELSAKDLCSLAWSVRSHPALGVADLVLDPESPSGHFERHISYTLGTTALVADHIFFHPVPVFDKTRGRILEDHPFLLPHERILATVARDEASMVAAGSPTMLRVGHVQTNPVLMAVGAQRCVLVHGYVDGVPFTGTASSTPDSLWVFTWVPMQHANDARQRRVVTVLRKTRACRCGCNGRCSLNAITNVIAWSFEALASGVHPAEGPAGAQLTGWRRQAAGTPMPVRGSLASFGADLAAYNEVLGFRSVMAKESPCFLCCCSKATMHAYDIEHLARTDAHWTDAVASTCIRISIAPTTAEVLQGLLRLDRRKAGGRGRCLGSDVAVRDVDGLSVLLKRGDRLQVGGSISDPHQNLGELGSHVVHLRFFRPAASSFIIDWSPLHRVLRLTDCVPDLMHTVDLGVAQYIAGEIFAFIITTDALGAGLRGLELNERLEVGARAIQERLLHWYASPEGEATTPAFRSIGQQSCKTRR